MTGPQLSLAIVPARTLGIAACPLSPAFTLVGAGAVIVGAVLSTTVTVCVACVELPAASVAVYVIVVIPVGKMLPAGTPVLTTVTLPVLSAVIGLPISASV